MTKDVNNVLMLMTSTASTGCDNITLKELCMSSPEILPVLTNIFNVSLHTSTFPARWKHSLITPTYKKGDICNMDNYCPNLLLSNLSKLPKKLVDVQERNYLNEQKIILPDQQGFVKGRSCDTALMNLSFRLFSSSDKSLYSAVAALDFTKAGNVANVTVRHRLFEAFVKPKLLFCLPVWGDGSQGSITKLCKTLTRALCIVLRNKSADFNYGLLKSYGMLPHEILLVHQNVCLLHSLLHNMQADNYVADDYFSIVQLSGHSTRGALSFKLQAIKSKKSTNKLCFIVSAIKLWNDLPYDITSLLPFFNQNTARLSMCYQILCNT